MSNADKTTVQPSASEVAAGAPGSDPTEECVRKLTALMPKSVVLHVCCNDENSGCFEGTCQAVTIDIGPDIDDVNFSPNYFDWFPRMSVDHEKKWLRIGGSWRIPFESTTAHVGNWCWDAFRIGRADAIALITWPKFRKWFGMEQAPTDFWDAYASDQNTECEGTQRKGSE